MKWSTTKMLGLAMSDRSIDCAEVSFGKGEPVLRRTATFEFDGVLSAATGKALREFLKRNQFSTAQAVVGLPAGWLLAAARDVPPADAAQMRAMLRLQTERFGGGDNGEIIFDYTGGAAATGGQALLVGARREQIRKLTDMLTAADLEVVGLTATALAVAATDGDSANGVMLLLERGGAEVVWRRGGQACGLRYLPPVHANGGGFAPAAAAVVRQALVAGGPAVTELALWNGLNLNEQEILNLSQRLGASLRPMATKPTTWPAAACIALAAGRERLPVDLLHSRLAPPRRHRLGRRGAWIIAIAAAAIVALAALYVGVLRREAELSNLESRLSELRPELKAAEHAVARFEFARGYFDARPPMLDCLRELTLAFRDDENVYVNGFSLRETGVGQLQGKAADQRFILAVLDRVKRNAKFRDVKLLDMRDAGGRTREVAFSLSFLFDAGAAPSLPATGASK